MKKLWSLFAATALAAGFAGTLHAAESASLAPADSALLVQLESGFTPAPALQGTRSGLVGTKAICQPGSFQYNCKEIWGVSQGRCGANTWRYTFCQQYKNSAGVWYYQGCGPVQEVCSPPGGAECIPCH